MEVILTIVSKLDYTLFTGFTWIDNLLLKGLESIY